jgi:23S rRNA pseudouridine2605 synthase
MRLNKLLAERFGISRRKADDYISLGLVKVECKKAVLGQIVTGVETIYLKNNKLPPRPTLKTVMLNKPEDYVCSRVGQGSKTVYDLLPDDHKNLKTIGRLDKNSSGLLLLTNDGELHYKLTHPKYNKQKIYIVNLSKSLLTEDLERIKIGIRLEDGMSKFDIEMNEGKLKVVLTEGRNRQIRRTFEKLGYKVTSLHRIQFGIYKLGNLKPGQIKEVTYPNS